MSITGGSFHHTRNFPLPIRSAETWDTTGRIVNDGQAAHVSSGRTSRASAAEDGVSSDDPDETGRGIEVGDGT